MVSPSNGARPGEHLVQHAAEGPDIGPLVDDLAARLLRAHVGGGAEDDPRAGARRSSHVGDCVGSGAPGSRVPDLRQAEVQHLDHAVGRDLDVGRLQIAMDDPLLVRRFERVGGLPRWTARQPSTARPSAIRSASVDPSTISSTSTRMPSCSSKP